MRSGELARFAGVTVRALRHYHQIGVLPEPERRSNGYREYDVHDVIRVLRIKRLAGIGVPLDRMAELLAEDGGGDGDRDTGRLLDELDAELVAEIERLSEQRRLIARIRELGAAPDIPPELAPFLAMSATALSPELARFDREASVLLAHFVGDDGIPRIADLYRRLGAPETGPMAAVVTERFSRLGPDNTDQEISELTEQLVATFAPVVEEFAASDAPIDLSESAPMFAEHAADSLNQQQRRVLEEFERRLGGDGTTAGGIP